MASTVADCAKIVQATKKAKGFFMTGHICRFNPRYAAAKREIESGKIGRIVSAYARKPAVLCRRSSGYCTDARSSTQPETGSSSDPSRKTNGCVPI